MSLDLDGRRVLVTGAAGGLGRAIAAALHARGAALVLSGRRADALDDLARSLGHRAQVVVADLADEGAPEQLAAAAGRVDVLVANAALPASGRLESFAPDQVDRALAVNLGAPIRLARALLPAMTERGAGHLVFVSSLSGKVAAGGGSVYSATKFGLRGFGLSLRDELHGTGVGVTIVYPGFVREAGMFADSGVKLRRGVGLSSPADVAGAVVRGIERDRAEVDVAPLPLRAAGRLAGAAPGIVAAVSRRLGGAEVADQLAEAQRDKR